jgi:indoleamine 2,3-dioxygenase
VLHREYVLKKTAHPTATGGSNIVTVSFSGSARRCAAVPDGLCDTVASNQLQAVMDAMVDVHNSHGDLPGCRDVMNSYVQRETLKKEVEKYCKERNVS